jgi:hypothetical protein
MGITVTLNTTYLDQFIDGMVAKVAAARQGVASDVQSEWQGDVFNQETTLDKADQRDYDANIVIDEDGPDRTVVSTDIQWAIYQEYGTRYQPARPSATQAAARARDRLPEAIAEALNS